MTYGGVVLRDEVLVAFDFGIFLGICESISSTHV